MTTISLNGYAPAPGSRLDESLTWPNEITIDGLGACEALYSDGETVLYTTVVECLAAHELDADAIVDWLDDEGRPLDSAFVATITDPERAERAQAAAQVDAALRQGLPRA